jgi:dTDP-4-dehydrorhamnose reductase
LNNAPLAWITGAHGLIGNELVRSAVEFAPHLKARGLSRETVDLLNFRGVEQLFHQERPALVIHCAAISRNPVCDADPGLAEKTNVEATRRLLELAGGIPFFFFSTDLVFDGVKGNYTEQDAPNPLSKYAETKVMAESEVRQYPQHTIIRISLTGGISRTGDRAFNEEMKKNWKAGRTLSLFTDEYRCPSTADGIARAVWELVLHNARGTFHLCYPERLSRYEIGLALAAKHPQLNPKIIPVSRRSYTGPPRPPDTSLNCDKAASLLSFRLPRFSDWLRADQTGF